MLYSRTYNFLAGVTVYLEVTLVEFSFFETSQQQIVEVHQCLSGLPQLHQDYILQHISLKLDIPKMNYETVNYIKCSVKIWKDLLFGIINIFSPFHRLNQSDCLII